MAVTPSAPLGAPASAPAAPDDRRLARRLFLLAFVVYNLNFRVVGAGDTYPARFLPFAILEHATLALDPVLEAVEQGHRDAYWVVRHRGHAMSAYPVVTPALVTPLYLPAVLYIRLAGDTAVRRDHVALGMEKASASLLASAAVAWMYLLLRRRASRREALLLACAFAFGTNTWMTSSQALWQHGAAELLAIAGLWFVTGPPGPGPAAAAGAACGLLVANRPPDVVLAAGLGLYACLRLRRWLLAVVAAAALPLAAALLYNLVAIGHPLGGYAAIGAATPGFFAQAVAQGLAGLLFSPTRGLLVFAPFLAVVPAFFARALRCSDDRLLAWILAGAVIAQLLLYARTDWRGGYSFGPRFLTDALPFLFWLLPPIVSSLTPVQRRTFLAACALAVAIQALGAFTYSGWTDLRIFAPAPAGRELAAAWEWRNAPFLEEPRHPHSTLRLLRILLGYPDPTGATPYTSSATPSR